MKKLAITLIILILLTLSISCSAAFETAPTPYLPPAPTATPRPIPTPTPSPTDGSQSSDERMTVRTAEMSLIVDDVTGTINRTTALAESVKGYVVSSSTWSQGDRLRGTIAIRVPASDFSSVMKTLGEMAVKITSQSISSKDVTEEYVDLSSKLQNLQATHQQLLKILEKAEKVEDVLNIQREVTRIAGEIEQVKGRMQYLERTTATSLINVNLEEAKPAVQFSADNVSIDEGEEVQFTSQITGGFAPFSYEWDFGDGTTSTNVSPAHQYKLPGKYTVTLKVRDSRGNTDTEVKKEYITVLEGWRASNTVKSAANGFVAFNKGFANFLIWFGIFSPVWIVIGGIIFWRRWRKKKAKAKLTSQK